MSRIEWQICRENLELFSVNDSRFDENHEVTSVALVDIIRNGSNRYQVAPGQKETERL